MNKEPRTRTDQLADGFCVGLTALSLSQVPPFLFNLVNRPDMMDIPMQYSGIAGFACAGLAAYLHERNHPAHRLAQSE